MDRTNEGKEMKRTNCNKKKRHKMKIYEVDNKFNESTSSTVADE